jgi:outer membrane protein
MKQIIILIFSIVINIDGIAQEKVFSLKQCIDTALSNNLELKQSELLMESAEVDWKQSKANLLPSLNGFVNHGISQGRSIDPFSNAYIDQRIDFAGYGLTSGITLFNGLALQHNIRQNAYSYEASKMELQQRKDNLTLSVILAYLQVLSNEDLVIQSKNQAEVSDRQVERLHKMNEEGAIAPSLLSDLQGEQAGNELTLINNKNALELSKLALFQLMNIAYDSSLKIGRINPDAFSEQDVTGVNAVYDKALEQLGLVKAANLRKHSAVQGVKVAQGMIYPTLSFNGIVNTNYSSAAKQNIFLNTTDVATNDYVIMNGVKTPVVGPRDNFRADRINYNKQLGNNLYTTVSLDLRVPLLNSFSSRNRIRKAKIELRNTDYIAETTKIQLKQAVEQAYLNMTAARNRYQTTIRQADAFAKSFRAAEAKFNEGVGSVVDYLIAKNNADRANSNLIISRYDYLLRKKVIDYYMGRGVWDNQ